MTLANRYVAAARQSPDGLVREYAPLVKRMANHLRVRLPDGVDQDDLIQVGLIALLEAARHYSTELKTENVRDPLTNAHNRRYFE